MAQRVGSLSVDAYRFSGDPAVPAAAGSAELDEISSRAEERDRHAQARDEAADVRDEDAQVREQDAVERDVLEDREAPTRFHYRRSATADRQGAFADRKSAAEDRAAAAEDRAVARSTIESLLHDELTGIYLRSAGLTELSRDMLKARRTGEPFTLAFVDVDHLKYTNDTQGHLAGDRLLARVADAVRAVVRDYDIIVRYGGDEFLCGTVGLTLQDAQSRYDQLNAHIAAAGGGTASVGVAQLRPEEDLDQLITRADAAMFARKRQ